MRFVVQAPVLVAALCGVALGACEDDDPEPEPEPFFPQDYESSYSEVRDCRGSGDHDLNNIRVFASPDAVAPYQNHVDPFPVGAVLIKAEYAFADIDCTQDIVQWTSMKRLANDSSPETLDWSWQQIDFDRNVVGEDSDSCIGCHTNCGEASPPDFMYDHTCAVP